MKKTFAIMILASVFALGACGDDDDDTVTPDAAPGVDSAVGGIDATVGCAADFAGCTEFEDLTGETEVSISPGAGNVYTPKCVKVSVGTVITIGASGVHPFASAACNADPIAAAGSTPVEFTPDAVGTYGYYCSVHGQTTGTGMAGAIQVVE